MKQRCVVYVLSELYVGLVKHTQQLYKLCVLTKRIVFDDLWCCCFLMLPQRQNRFADL